MSTQHTASNSAESGKSGDGDLKRASSSSPPPSTKVKPTGTDEHQHLDYRNVPTGSMLTTRRRDDASKPLQIIYHKGNMFAEAPENCVLIHACNTQGHWGAGIAKAFKQQYPKAYADHNRFCAKEHSKSDSVPTGAAQLLAPRDTDKHHWIGCVFTSAKHGKAKDKPNMILYNTKRSMHMLFELISQVDDKVSTIRMCKINSGKFGVPWEKTEEVLQTLDMQPHWRTKIEVWEPDE